MLFPFFFFFFFFAFAVPFSSFRSVSFGVFFGDWYNIVNRRIIRVLLYSAWRSPAPYNHTAADISPSDISRRTNSHQYNFCNRSERKRRREWKKTTERKRVRIERKIEKDKKTSMEKRKSIGSNPSKPKQKAHTHIVHWIYGMFYVFRFSRYSLVPYTCCMYGCSAKGQEEKRVLCANRQYTQAHKCPYTTLQSKSLKLSISETFCLRSPHTYNWS